MKDLVLDALALVLFGVILYCATWIACSVMPDGCYVAPRGRFLEELPEPLIEARPPPPPRSDLSW